MLGHDTVYKEKDEVIQDEVPDKVKEVLQKEIEKNDNKKNVEAISDNSSSSGDEFENVNNKIEASDQDRKNSEENKASKDNSSSDDEELENTGTHIANLILDAKDKIVEKGEDNKIEASDHDKKYPEENKASKDNSSPSSYEGEDFVKLDVKHKSDKSEKATGIILKT